jgi:hypothetical protein
MIDPHDQNCSEARHESKETREIQQLGEQTDRDNVIGLGNLDFQDKQITMAMTPSLKDPFDRRAASLPVFHYLFQAIERLADVSGDLAHIA